MECSCWCQGPRVGVAEMLSAVGAGMSGLPARMCNSNLGEARVQADRERSYNWYGKAYCV